MYLMITVISNIDKLKPTLKALRTIGVKGNVVIDAMGTTNIDNNYLGYRPALESTLIAISESSQYKKVILSILDSEEMVSVAMETIKKTLGNNMKKPNTGIMFTIPLIGLLTPDPEKFLELSTEYLKN